MLYTPIDRDLCDAVVLRLANPVEDKQAARVRFQFPPKILSDNRRGTWEKGEMRGTEPIATFSTSGPREIALSWTYIVDGGDWSTGAVAGEVRKIRGYYAQVRDKPDINNLIVYFKMWMHGGPSEISCRIEGIDVKHSETVICPPGRDFRPEIATPPSPVPSFPPPVVAPPPGGAPGQGGGGPGVGRFFPPGIIRTGPGGVGQGGHGGRTGGFALGPASGIGAGGGSAGGGTLTPIVPGASGGSISMGTPPADFTYPLRTDITIELRLWTQGWRGIRIRDGQQPPATGGLPGLLEGIVPGLTPGKGGTVVSPLPEPANRYEPAEWF